MWFALIITAAIVLFLYPFVLYPALLLLLRRRQTRPAETESAELPTVALVICALNEQKFIGQKLDNSLALEYPAGKLHIVVVSDGSTDRTAEITRGFVESGVELIDRKVRRGKIGNLNEVLAQRSEEIVVLSDANVLYRRDAVLRLVERFRDPSVGCVSGKVILTDTTEILDGPTEQYYSIEWFLQEQASEIYSMVGADGAMYALRRELFRPCPNDTLIEDFVIPMNIVRQGKRVVFEPKAIGWEGGVSSITEEFRRKVRIAAGASQAMLRGNGWPGNAPLRFWFVFLSHKLLRWLSPVMGILILLLCLLSVNQPFSQVLLAGIGLVSLLAVFRLATGWNFFILSAPFYFLIGQVAMAIGLIKGLRGRQSVLWAKADR